MSTTTRAVLRRSIGRLCGDLIVATATGSGSTTTFVDTLNLIVANDALIGRQAFYASGTSANLYTTRYVSANVETTGTVTVSVAWSSSSAANDVLELYSSRSIAPSPAEIHDKINDCIRFVADENLTIVDSTDATFDADDPYIDIPSTWVGVIGAQWQDSLSRWHDIPKADWQLHRNLGTYGKVELKGFPRWYGDARMTHLIGVTPAGTLSSDTNTTIVHPEWIIKQAAGELLIQNARTYEDTAGAERRGNLWLQQAAALRPKAQTRPPANYVRVNRQ